jgi:hypothetical protein
MISAIPPSSEAQISGDIIYPSTSSLTLVPFVWAEEGHGNYNAQVTTFYYIGLAIVYSIIFAYLGFWDRIYPTLYPGKKTNKWIALKNRSYSYLFRYIVIILIGQFIFVQIYLYYYQEVFDLIFGLSSLYIPILIGFEIIEAILVAKRMRSSFGTS